MEDEKHWFAVSMLEVYNEQIRDLFATKEDAGIRYEVKQDEFGSTYVSNLRDRVCAVSASAMSNLLGSVPGPCGMRQSCRADIAHRHCALEKAPE